VIWDLTVKEASHARSLGLFTVTSETERGYYVTLFREMSDDAAPVRLSQSKECARPSTARRRAACLVRKAMAFLTIGEAHA